MNARYVPYSVRTWLIAGAIIVPYTIAKQAFGIDYPSWVDWIGILLLAGIGSAILVRPEFAGTRSSAIARLIGTAVIAVAACGAYLQFTKFPVE